MKKPDISVKKTVVPEPSTSSATKISNRFSALKHDVNTSSQNTSSTPSDNENKKRAYIPPHISCSEEKGIGIFYL